ncbi:MAG TPA: hypothetical protein VIE14_07765 [Steroidobacteraceae bacterium]|jgi:hypothetical protein
MTRPARDCGRPAALLARAVLAMAMAGLLCACVTSARYRLAPKKTPAVPSLDLRTPAAPLEVDLGAVIIFKGPGSWKSEARWDEYVVAVTNHGQQPLFVESVELIDVEQVARYPGDDPWKLEELSRTNWDRYGKRGLALAAGAGGVALYSAALADVAASPWLAGGAAGSAMVALAVIPVVALADVSVVALRNHHNKRAVEQEFQRRRLTLPHELAPGGSAAGSLFFPMTPGPQRLLVRGHVGGEPVVATLELPVLARLHLKPAT